MPSASRTSAEPHAELAARFPCFATAAPAAAATSAAVGGDVEGARAVAAGADDVDERCTRRRHRDDVLGHRLGEAGDLVDRLALGAEADEQAADLRGRRLAAHHDAHHVARLGARQVAAVGDGSDRGGDHVRKFLAMVGPSGVRTLSGWNWTPSDGIRDVADAHHLAVVGPRRHDEVAGHRRRGERVVAADLDLVGQAREDPAAVVRDEARLPVQERSRLADLAAERLHDRLMAEADAECPRRRPEPPDELDRHARVAGAPGPGGDDEPVGSERDGLVGRDRVVPDGDDLGAELLEQVHEVVGERVVVVDHQDLHRLPSPARDHRAASCSARSIAASSAASLRRHSSCSAAGSESATIPAPAWRYAVPSRITIVRSAMHASMVPPGSE